MERVFLKGNEAIAEAAVRAGCRFFAGYPITPQNEIPEYMSRRLPEVGGNFVQGESEVASINMVIGAAAAGTKALTSSSSPGISLKTEGISSLAGLELPAVIINVTRGGPGVGSIQAAQMDYFQATKACGHGGFRMLVYAPSTVQEAVDLVVTAFDKAEEYQAPMLVCADGCIGAMMEPVVLPPMREVKPMQYHFYTKEIWPEDRMIVTSILSPEENQEKYNMLKAKMYEHWDETECRVEEYMTEDAEVILTAYGTSARIAKTAIGNLRRQGYKIGMYVRFMAFSNGDLEALYDKSEGFFRRQLILQTRRKPPGREDDPFLSDKLKQEAEGIFLWCLDGLKRLQANNYRFTVSQRAAENKEHAKRNANNLVEFMQSEGYIQLKADSTITSRDLYAIYQTWCEDNGYRPIAQRSVGSYLKSHLEDYNLEASNKITKPQYAILRFAKYKGPEIGRIEAHDERTKEKYASNPDVDTGRSRLNFHLVKPRRSYRAEAEKQISEAGCRARKDSVRVVETLITASPEFFANKKPREVSD